MNIRVAIGAAVVLAVSLLASSSGVAEVTWEGRQFHLPVPDGWCALHADDRNGLFAWRKKATTNGEVQLVYAIPCSKLADADNGARVFDGFAWGGMIGNSKPLMGVLRGDPATFIKNVEDGLRQAFAQLETAQAKGQTLPGNNSQILDSRIEKSTPTAVFASRILHMPGEQNGEAMEALSVIAMTVIGDSAFRLEMQGRVVDGASAADFVKAEEAQIAAAQARQPQPIAIESHSAPDGATIARDQAVDEAAKKGFLLGGGMVLLTAFITGSAAYGVYRRVAHPWRGVLAYLTGLAIGLIGVAVAQSMTNLDFDPTRMIVYGAMCGPLVGIQRAKRQLRAAEAGLGDA
jgi:hypothetical protein